MLSVSEAYCDKITATLDASEFVRCGQEFHEIAESLGGKTDVHELGMRSVRFRDKEQILVQQTRNLTRVTINGRAIATLRLYNRFAEALGVIGAAPHRVTQIHAKVDVHGDDLTGHLARYSDRALSVGVHGVPSTKSRAMLEVRPDTLISKNTYVGTRKAELQRCVYDKRLERHVRGYKDFEDSIDELSVELRVQKGVRRAGLSLRDAFDVRPLFWEYMDDCPIVGEYKPKDTPVWSSTGSGFECERKVRTAVEKVRDYDLYGDWRKMFEVANECGQLEVLLHSMQSRANKLLEGL
jgi:hypothetical protein